MKRKVLRISSSFQEKKSNQRKFKNNLIAFDIHFWMHFVGFALEKKRKNIFKIIASVVLAFTADIINFCYAAKRLRFEYNAKKNIEKEFIIVTIVFLLEFYLRFLAYKNRTKFKEVNRRLISVYNKISESNILKLKWKIMANLFLNDFISIVPVIYSISVSNFSFASSNTLYISLRLLYNWNVMTVIIPAHFGCYCFILSKILGDVKKQLVQKDNKIPHHFYSIYDEINDLVVFMNEQLHSMLLISFTLLFVWMFFHVYVVIFSQVYVEKEIRVLMSLVLFFRVILMCSLSSSVTKSSTEVKDLVFRIPCKVTPFILNIQNKVCTFTLLDSIVIGKSLVVTFIGSLLTYGMLIITFN